MSSSDKKGSLSDCSREELLTKCKGLLQIASRAKAAKDDALKELSKSRDEASALQEMVTALQEEKISRASEVENAKRKADQCENERDAKDRQVQRVSAENEDLLKQMDTFETAYKEEIIVLNEKLKAKAAEVTELGGKAMESGNELKALQFKLEKSEQTIDSLQKRLKVAEEWTDSSAEMQQIRTDNDNLKQKLSETEEKAQEEKESLSETNEYLQWELKEKTSRVQELETAMKADMDALGETLSTQQTLNASLVAERDLLLQDKEKLERELYEANEMSTEKEEESEELTKVKEAYESKVAHLENQMTELRSTSQASVDEMKEQICILQSEKLKYEEELATHKTEAERFQSRTNELDEKLTSLETENETLKKEVANERQRVVEVESELEKSRTDQSSSTENLKSIITKLEAELDHVKAERESLASDIATKEKDLTEKYVRIQSLEDEIKESEEKLVAAGESENALRRDLDSKERKLLELERDPQEDVISQSISDLETQLSSSRVQFEQVNQRLTEKDEQNKMLSEQLEELKSRLGDYSKSNDSLKQDAASKEEEIAKISRELEKNRSDQSSSERFESELAAREQEVTEKMERILLLEEEITQANIGREELNGALEKANEDMTELRCQLDEATNNIDSQNSTISHLKEEAFNFSEMIGAAQSEKAALNLQVDNLTLSLNNALQDKESAAAELSLEEEELTKLSQELQEVNAKLLKSEESSKSFQTLSESLESQAKALRHELESTGDTTADTISHLQEAIKEKELVISALEQKVEQLDQTARTNEAKELKLQEELQVVVAKLLQAEEERDRLRNESNKVHDEKAKQSESLAKALKCVQNMKSDFRQLEKESKMLLQKQVQDMALFAQSQQDLLLPIKNDITRELSNSISRGSEVLEELNVMNGELKKRGEKISSLEGTISQLRAQAALKEKELNETRTENKEKLDEDKAEVHKLQAELEQLKGELEVERKRRAPTPHTEAGQPAADVQSEVMSTSTVSKAEEANRMADIENSFEERYAKLKLVALKLKKKTVDQDKQIKELNASIASSSKEKLATLTANYAKLQQQNDEQGDIIDEQKKTLITLKKDMETAVAESAEAKEKSAKLDSDLTDLKAKHDLLTSEVVDLKQQVSEKETVLAAHQTEMKQLQEKESELRLENSEMTAKLSNLSDADKKHDLLDMELETAERRIEELSKSLEEQRKKVEEAAGDREREVKLKENAEQIVRDLEVSLQREQDRAEDFKAKLMESRQSVSSLEVSLSEAKGEAQALSHRLQDVSAEKERLSCELSDVSGNAASSAQTLNKRVESLQKMVSLLETDLERRKKALEESESRMMQLEKDYESYKVRAQSVLRQAKEADTQLGSKSQEIIALERVIQSLNEKIQDMSTQIATSELEMKHLQEDHDRLMERHSALLQEMASKELTARHKHEQLIQVANQAEKARQDALIGHQEQVESLRQSYKSQMEDQHNNHTAEVARLQKQIDDLDNKIIRLQMTPTKGYSPSPQANHRPESTGINVNLLEREAAEGSETQPLDRATSQTPPASVHGRSSTLSKPVQTPTTPMADTTPLPLDKLLQQDESAYVRVTSTTPTISSPSSFNQLSSAELEARAVSAEKRLRHLATLLSESESENARLGQLAEVLKEEIRTYQRSEERKKHIENLEYVKNVILKFLTLPGGEDKARLIPVLTTILRLSPAEVQQIQEAIKVEIESAAPQEVGWSNYLGLWSQ